MRSRDGHGALRRERNGSIGGVVRDSGRRQGGFSVAVQVLRGTVVVLEHFDPVTALQAIEHHRVTHSQWVPTMSVRMLKLPEAERTRFDLSSHRMAIHAAAPGPRP